MGLSLRRFGRSLWEGITPQNEGALRQAEANLARANAAASRPAQYGVLANPQARQQFVQGNQPERFNAPRVYAQVGGDVAINTFLGGAKRFGQDVAGWGLSPMTNRFANQERERAQRLLGPAYENLYRAYGQDPRLGANQASMEADIADYNLRTDPLQRSGIGVNDNVARKVLAHGAEAALDIATAGTGPAAFKASKLAKAGKAFEAVKPSIAAGAALGAGSNLAYVAGTDAKPLDYVKSAALGGAIGATLPALGGLSGKRARLNKNQAIKDRLTKPFREDTGSTPVGGPLIPIPKKVQEKLAQAGEAPQGPVPKQNLVDSSPKDTTKYRNRTADEAIREIASIGGEQIGESNSKLGLTGEIISAATGGKYTTTRGLNPFRAASDAAGRAYTSSAEEAITGAGAPVTNKVRALGAGTGLADETKAIARRRSGGYGNVTDLMSRLSKKSDEIQAAYGPEAQELLDRTIRDAQYTKRVYGEAPRKVKDLPPELQKLVADKTAQNKIINDLNRQTGVIDERTWMHGTKGQHIGRVFNIPKSEKRMMHDGISSMLETSPGIKRKDISKMADETIALLERDPIRAIDLRMELALRNKIFVETMDDYASRGFIKPKAPNDSYIKVNGKRWGKYDGQYIERGILEDITDNRVFNNEMMQSYNRLVEGYKGTLLGASDRLQKAFKTTMAPGTIVGNIFSNPFLFNVGAGTNPLTQIYDMMGAYKKIAKGLSDGDVYEARRLGVIGGDTGRILTGSSNEKMAVNGIKENISKRALNKFGRFYSGIDDGAKLGLWTRLKKQGMNPEDAALEVAKFTQDYNNVGRTITLIADTPVLGKPFARFSPELVRIIKNNATRAPHRMLAGLAGLAYISNKMSQDSGETEEERAAREDAVGQTKVPGTAWINKLMGGPDNDISLNLVRGDTAVNIARSVGLNFPIEPGVDPNRALIEQLLPVEIPITKDALGNSKFDPTKVVTSMTARPLIEQLFDKNFMGSRVSDPTNRAYDSQGNVMKYTDLSTKDQIKNRVRALGVSLSPLGNEADSITSAITGKPTVTGKTRTVPQAALRVVGIKTENWDKESRQKKSDTAEYFDTTKKAEEDFLNTNKDLESLYFKVFPKTKDRNTGKKVSEQISPEKWANVRSDSSGRLFEFMRSQAIEQNKRDPKYAVDPIFQLSTPEQKKQVLDLRSRPTGEDIETEEILRATKPWYTQFEKAEEEYYKKSSEYYKSKNLPDTQSERAKAYGDIKYPEQSALIKKYYQVKGQDIELGKEFYKANADALSNEFKKYKQERLNYINARRKIEGFPPIDANVFNNVTFGYEDDERKVYNELKYAKGYGGYGGYGSGGGGSKNKPNVSSVAKYFIDSDVGGKPAKASISVKAPGKVVAKKSGGKPKVSIKKSLV